MSQQKVSLSEMQTKLYDKLQASGWHTRLKAFILTEDFKVILKKLIEEVNDGMNFTPGLKQVFRAFEECPYQDLKVVMIAQDPYPQMAVADGVAFSCSNTNKAEKSLQYIFKEIEKQYYPDGDYSHDCDLSRWSKQGVLMLNTALTTRVGKIGAHYDIWNPFTAFLLDQLNTYNPGIVYVFIGKKAEEWSEFITTGHKLFVPHPASAAYKGAIWDSKELFIKINDLCKSLNNDVIIW